MDATRKNDQTATTNYDDDFILKIACATPLPTGTAKNTTKAAAAPKLAPAPAPSSPKDHESQQHRPSSELPPPPHSLPKLQKRTRRNRPPSFDIFADPDVVSPRPKKSATTRKDGRTPLGVRRDFGNSTPTQSPRGPATPFTFRPWDSSWVEFENYGPFSPPTTPSTPSSPPPPPPPPPHQSQRAQVRRSQVNTKSRVAGPRNLVLYDLLELQDWKAGSEEIKAAYKKVAVKYHPDKVTGEERQEATVQMQRINAARDVLLNAVARKKYNKDGKLPWVA